MLKRLLGVALFAALAFGPLANIALAAEDSHGPVHHELPSINEVGSQSDVAREFFPKPQEAPSVFPWFAWPLMIGAVALSLVVMLSYLVFQPRFTAERKAKAQRKR